MCRLPGPWVGYIALCLWQKELELSIGLFQDLLGVQTGVSPAESVDQQYYSWTVAERLELSIGPFLNLWVCRWVLGPVGLLANCSSKRTGAKYKTLLEFLEAQMGVSPARSLCQPDCSQATARTSWS